MKTELPWKEIPHAGGMPASEVWCYCLALFLLCWEDFLLADNHWWWRRAEDREERGDGIHLVAAVGKRTVTGRASSRHVSAGALWWKHVVSLPTAHPCWEEHIVSGRLSMRVSSRSAKVKIYAVQAVLLCGFLSGLGLRSLHKPTGCTDHPRKWRTRSFQFFFSWLSRYNVSFSFFCLFACLFSDVGYVDAVGNCKSYPWKLCQKQPKFRRSYQICQYTLCHLWPRLPYKSWFWSRSNI